MLLNSFSVTRTHISSCSKGVIQLFGATGRRNPRLSFRLRLGRASLRGGVCSREMDRRTRATELEDSLGERGTMQWEKGGIERNCGVREEVNTFTIRLRIFVSDNLLAKLGKLAATAGSLHGQTYISSVARSAFPFCSFNFNFRVLGERTMPGHCSPNPAEIYTGARLLSVMTANKYRGI